MAQTERKKALKKQKLTVLRLILVEERKLFVQYCERDTVLSIFQNKKENNISSFSFLFQFFSVSVLFNFLDKLLIRYPEKKRKLNNTEQDKQFNAQTCMYATINNIKRRV